MPLSPLPNRHVKRKLLAATQLVLALAAVAAVAAEPKPESIWRHSTDLGETAYAQGHYREAEQNFRTALTAAEKLGKTDPRHATALYNLAMICRLQARYAEAEPLLKQALAIRQKALGTENLDTATAMHSLGNVYRAQGRFAEADKLYEESAAIAEKILGPGHPGVANYQPPRPTRSSNTLSAKTGLVASLNSLADLYRAQGRYSEAEPLYKQALALAEQDSLSGNPGLVVTLNNLADLYVAQKRHQEAEPLYKKALELSAQLPGAPASRESGRTVGVNPLADAQPDQAITLNNLADLKRAQGQTQEAEQLYLRALELDEREFGPNHPSVAVTLNNLADLYESQGRHGEAAELARRAQAIREKVIASESREISTYREALVLDEISLGYWHPDIVVDLNDLADLYRALGRYPDAEALYRRALAIAETNYGPDDARLTQALNNLADLYRAQSRYAEAEPLYKRAVALAKKTAEAVKAPGPGSSTSAESPSGQALTRADLMNLASDFNELADNYRAQRRYADAEPLYWRALTLSEKALGVGHPKLAVTLNNLGDLYRAQGRTAEAEPLYKRALSIRGSAFSSAESPVPWAVAIEAEVLGVDRAQMAVDLRSLADCYAQDGKYTQAESLYKQALSIQEKAPEAGGAERATTLEHYARMLKASQREAEAAQLEARAKAIRSGRSG